MGPYTVRYPPLESDSQIGPIQKTCTESVEGVVTQRKGGCCYHEDYILGRGCWNGNWAD